MRKQALQITAVIKGFVRWIKSMIELAAGNATRVIGFIAILKPVWEHEVNDFILRQTISIVLRCGRETYPADAP